MPSLPPRAGNPMSTFPETFYIQSWDERLLVRFLRYPGHGSHCAHIVTGKGNDRDCQEMCLTHTQKKLTNDSPAFHWPRRNPELPFRLPSLHASKEDTSRYHTLRGMRRLLAFSILVTWSAGVSFSINEGPGFCNEKTFLSYKKRVNEK